MNEAALQVHSTNKNTRKLDLEVSDSTLEQVNPIQDTQYRSLISIPLITGAEQLGLINCYSGKARRFTA